MKVYFYIVCFFMLQTTLFSQINVTGSVMDSNGEVIIGTNVIIKGKSKGTVVDFDGNFNLVVSNSEAVLVFSTLGFISKEIKVGDRRNFIITLEDNIESLKQVIVVGYGTEDAKDVTGSLAVVNGEELANTSASSFDEALQGRVSGVTVTSEDGSPGAPAQIIIRGSNSITGVNGPLYVVDGVPLEDFDPSSINPSDIDSFTILKDASSTAIYGARGSNGVIVITTKIGNGDGTTTVKVGVRHNISWIPNRLEVLGGYDYVKYRENHALAFDHYKVHTTTENFAAVWGRSEEYKDMEGTSWQDEVFTTANTTQLDLSMSGGSKESSFSFTAQALDQEGTVITTGFKRLTTSLRLSHKINRKIEFSTRFNLGLSERNGANIRDTRGLTNMFTYQPVDPIYKDQYDEQLLSTGRFDSDDPRFIDPYTPVDRLRSNNSFLKSIPIGLNTDITYRFTSKFYLKSKFAYNANMFDQGRFFGAESREAMTSLDGISGSITKGKNTTTTSTSTLNYKNTLGIVKVTGLLGTEYQRKTIEKLTASAKQLPTDVFGLNNLGIGNTALGGEYRASKSLSFFSRLSLAVKDKYLFSGTYRVEGSSKFAKGNRIGFYPSFSFGWVLGKEEFMQNILQSMKVNNLKLRFGWGVTANNRIRESEYLSQLTLNSNTGYLQGDNKSYAGGVVQSKVGYSDLTWETTTQADAGIDISLLKNRLKITSDVYYKITTDMLMMANVPISTGFGKILQNVGSIRNMGFEFAANTNWIKRKNISWNTNFNISFNRNKIIKLNGDQKELFSQAKYPGLNENNYISELYGPAGQIYGFQYDRIYQMDDFYFDSLADSYILKEGISRNLTTVVPGSIKYKDQNGDGVITQDDRVIIGNPLPTHRGGILNKVKWKSFDFSVFMQWSYGGDLLNATRAKFSTPIRSNQNGLSDIANAWTPSNTNTDVNTVKINNIFGYPQVGYQIDSRYVEDGSYIRLKSITIGYRVPKKLYEKYGITDIKLNTSAQNLYTFTKYSGYNPDVNLGRGGALTPGFDYGSYPQSITISTGITIQF